MAKTVFLYFSELEPELGSGVYLKPITGFADAGTEVYLDELSRRVRLDDYFGQPDQVIKLLFTHLPDWTEKIIVKSRPEDRIKYMDLGFREEALVHGYFSGIDMHFLTYYPKPERSESTEIKPEASGISRFTAAEESGILNRQAVIRTAIPEDAGELARFYSNIFPLYPTPVSDPEYIKDAIEGNSIYRYIRQNGVIVSAACAEINRKYSNAELSDCGTSASASGRGYMKSILSLLIKELDEMGVNHVYSIARANNPGINSVFKGLGFECTGTLIQNVFIFSGFEDMKVWSRVPVVKGN